MHGLSKPSVGFELTLNYYVLPFNPSLHMRSWRNRFARVKILAGRREKIPQSVSFQLSRTASQLLCQNFARAMKRSRRLRRLFQSSLPLSSSFFPIYSMVIPKLLSTIKRRSKSIVIFNMAVDYANTCVIQ